ncbi:MAG: hypothetical protein WBF42_09505 [Terracidiphilus sp.]
MEASKGPFRVALFLTIPVVLIFLLAVRVIPPVMGRVVDAVSGKPIRDIRVTMELSRSERALESPHTELQDGDRSGMSGWVFLKGAVRQREFLFPKFGSYWLTVNEGAQISDQQDESAAASQVMYDPMFNQRPRLNWVDDAVGDKRYFPLTVTAQREGCDRLWRATCAYKPFWWGISLPLIPVLDDIDDCKKIGNSLLRENCRQLNTYRAAFVHAGTYEEVQKGKALCAEVDHGALSAACLQQLEVYVANPDSYQRPFKPQVNEPVPDGMFPDSIAGLPVMNNRACRPQHLFLGFVDCAASYGSGLKTDVVVYITRWPDGSNKPTARNHLGSQRPEATEVRAGANVLRFRGHISVQSANGKRIEHENNDVSYVWYSGNTLVEVLFFDPIPEQDKFLSYYLGRFPGTSQ